MAISDEELRQRLFTAQESFDTELKPWIDPASDVGKAVIAKACLALRNLNGGVLIIGVADDGSCRNDDVPADIRERYCADRIHDIITKFSSEAFEVRVHFVEREGHPRVIIEVPSGVRTPVFCRNNLPRNSKASHKTGSLLRLNEFYVRTLVSNGRVSSAPAGALDWPRMMDICFNNREADIGAFVRRQLSGLDPTGLIDALQHVIGTVKAPTSTELLNAYMDEMYTRFTMWRDKHEPPPPKTGIRESAAIIIGDFARPSLSDDYMVRFMSVPRYSGWPPWVGLMHIHSGVGETGYIDNGWESFEYVETLFNTLDFSRMDESGRFYYVEALQDDITDQVPRGKHFEFVIETARVAEIIATCLAFAKEFCGPESSNDLVFAFRWRGLRGRWLSTWANPGRSLRLRESARQDEVITYATIPLATAPDAIGLHVEAVVKPLFRLFGGCEFDSRVIQDIVTRRLTNRG